MYFKVEQNTETYKRFTDLFKKMDESNNAAWEFVEKLGFKRFTRPHSNIAGGVSGVLSEDKPSGYKSVDRNKKTFYPKKSNTYTLLKFESLPIVTIGELNDIIGFEKQYHSNTYYRHFGYSIKSNFILVHIDDNCNYTPKSDMVEILSSEYKALEKKDNGEQP